MKTLLNNYKKVMEVIKKVSNRLKKNEDYIKKVDADYYNGLNTARENNDKNLLDFIIQENKENENEYIKVCDAIYKDKLKLKFLDDNKKSMLFEDIKPVLAEILTTYKNKQLGEKTRDKIKNDFKNKTGCGIWFEEGAYYSTNKIHIYVLNENGFNSYNEIEINTPYDEPIIKDNKIISDDISKLYIREKYHENINKSVNDLIKAHKKALDAINKAEEALKDYRENAPTTIRSNIDTYISNKPYNTIL